MKIMSIGIVTNVNSYEKDGQEVNTVSVGLGRDAFNVGVPNPDDFYMGDVVVLYGDLGVGKTGLFLRDSRIEVASEADRERLGFDVRQRPAG